VLPEWVDCLPASNSKKFIKKILIINKLAKEMGTQQSQILKES